MFRKVNHIAIIVSDYETSKSFYSIKLGFKIIEELKRESKSTILYLDANGTIIELFHIPDAPQRLTYPEALGLRHLAFDVDDFDKTIKKLNEKGIVTEPIRYDERTGKRMTFFFDPDKLPLEICER